MTVALVLAAGSGERLAAGRPKALVELAGRPMLAWSVTALARVPGIERIVIMTPPALGAPETDTLEQALAGLTATPFSFAPGGGARSESVLRGLAACPEGELVLVHDAARPLVTPELAEAVLGALEADAGAHAAIAAVPVTDTIKRVDSGGAVLETLTRSELWAVQTPQVFRRAALEAALDVAPDELAGATDDAWLVERAGGRVLVVAAGGDENLKVTTPLDLRIAGDLLAEREQERERGAAGRGPNPA